MKINSKNKGDVLFKYIWIIAIMPKQIQFFLLGILAMYLINRSKIALDRISLFIIGYAITHVISIYINIIGNDYSSERILAAINTALVWLVAILIYLYYKNNKIDIGRIIKYSIKNLIIMNAFLIIAMLFYYIFHINEVSIFRKALYGIDWYGGVNVIRFSGLLEYPNLVALFFMIFYPISMIKYNNSSMLKKIVVSVIFLLPVIFSRSRSGYILAIVAIGVCLLNDFLSSSKRKKYINVFFLMIIMIIVFILIFGGLDAIKNILITMFNSREGSNNTRMNIYAESIRMTMINSPIIGCGIKNFIGDYPLGSHSTYIGIFYKTGLLGSVLFILALYNIVKSLIKNLKYKRFIFGAVFCLAVLVIGIVEDLDGSNWFLSVYFAVIGITTNLYNFTEEKLDDNY